MFGIALYLLPHKSPVVITLLLLASYAMLFHIAWNFWWIEESRLRQIVAVIVLAIAVVAFGYYVWPSSLVETANHSPEPSLLFEWFTRCVAYLRTLPWYSIAPSFIVGAAVAAILALLRERARRKLICPESWLHRRKADDKDRIKELVRIAGIQYRPEIRKGQQSYVDFFFSVFNNSLYDIVVSDVISDSTKTGITYGNDRTGFMLEAKMQDNQAKPCLSRCASSFTIRQPLYPGEADFLSSPTSNDSHFWFSGLVITFDGADINATRLDINHWLKKGLGQWVNYEPQFAFVSSPEHWVEVVGLERVEREAQITALRTERDELKSKLDEQAARILQFETTENQAPLNDDI